MRQSVPRRAAWVALPLSLACALATSFVDAVRAADPPRQRNILLMISDDQGLHAGCYGDRVVKTPNIDKLAADGVRFTNAYAGVASCSPSRSVILSGMLNHSNGQYGLAHAEHNFHSRPNIRGLPVLLGEQGYRSAVIGKYHVLPESAYKFDKQIPNNGRNGATMARAAAEFIKETPDQPFFLLMGYTDPHRAGQGFGNAQDYPGLSPVVYDPAAVSVPPFLPDEPEVRADVADYYQSVSRFDQGLGLMLKVLEETGHAQDTLVIYCSDNGMPFPGAKTTLYQAGIHLPLIIRDPTQKQRGRVNQAMVSFTDIAPTALAWAGIKPPPAVQGRSLLPILDQNDPRGFDVVFASHTFHEITMYNPMRTVITRQHKLIWNLAHQLPTPFASDIYNSPTWQGILRRGDNRMGGRTVEAFLHRPEFELFDLTSDPDEFHNLATDPSMVATIEELKGKLLEMMVRTNDPWCEPVGRVLKLPARSAGSGAQPKAKARGKAQAPGRTKASPDR